MDEAALHNKSAWNSLVHKGSGFARPASTKVLNDATDRINIYGWLPDGVQGKKVLCLAAGGGKHGPIYAAAGADVTVVDISESMLSKDLDYAKRFGLKIKVLAACMTHMPELRDAEFDVIMQPVSSCYIKNLRGLFSEVSRLLKPGGLYIVQHKQPISLQASALPDQGKYYIEQPWTYHQELPPVVGCEHREEGTLEYIHTLESLIGGMCEAGLVVEDLKEPRHGDMAAAVGTFRHRSAFIPPYIAIKSRRRFYSNIANPDYVLQNNS